MNKIYIIPIWILFLLSTGGYAQIQHSVSFDRNKLEVASKQENGTTYTVVNYKDCVSDDPEGFPSLPYQFLSFIVPNGPASFSVSIGSVTSTTMAIPYQLYPVQPPIPILSNATAAKFRNPDLAQYGSTNRYPENGVQIVGEGYLDGDKRIITVKVAPVQYIAANNQLVLNTTVNFTINFNQAITTGSSSLAPIASINKLNGNALVKSLNFVVNQSDISRYTSPSILTVSPRSLSIPSYEYVVITTEELAASFLPLVSWKRLKGIDAGIVTIESILKEPSITKDEISNLSDNAGKTRQYLRLAYQKGTKYVLFGGNSNILPIRYGSGYNNGAVYDAAQPFSDSQIPSDLYFSDLNGDWNKDGDPYLGEQYEDAVDYYPELYVGRILCETPQEVRNYIDKLFIYERNPGKGDFSYLKKAFYSQMNEMQRNQEAQTISKLMEPYFNQYTIYEEEPSYNAKVVTFPTGKQTIDKMNEHFGFIGFMTHGEAYGMAVAQQDVLCSDGKHYWTGITSYDSYCGNYNNEVGNGLDCLQNFNHPFVVYSSACLVTPFDKINPDLTYNIGQGLTTAGKYGGVAFLSNTRYGWVGSSATLWENFVKELPISSFQLGKAEALSKTYHNSWKHWLALTHSLIGCPEFKMWTNIPSSFTNVTINKTDNNLTVNTQADDCEVALTGLFGEDLNIQKSVGRSCQFSYIPRNYAITVYKHNYLPYIAPIYLQNENIIGKHYLLGDKIVLGSSVDKTKQRGDIVIKNNADVTIETSDCVTLEGGFTVEVGAVFEIKPNK